MEIPDDLQIRVDPTTMWEPPKWDNRGGRVTLACDASSCLLRVSLMAWFGTCDADGEIRLWSGA